MTNPTSGTSAAVNPVAALKQFGQSVWLDFIRRSLIASGELKRLVDDDGLGGVTSNPAIFEKAIDGSDDYATAIQEITDQHPGLGAKAVYERLAIKDIQDAADVLRPVYDRTGSHDGYVSLEVSPDLANDTNGTLAEARQLWKTVARPNVMIKVPATPAGLPAIRTLIGEGINVNVTLLFARDAYEVVAQAFIEGLEARAAAGQPLNHVASVASFFVSRIDTVVDHLVDVKLKTATGAEKARLEGLAGKVAIANAKLAYQSYKRIFAGPRWEALHAKGAQRQRVLWASTGSKNPHYSDVLYVEELIGPDTVNTVPPATLSAFRDHGRPRASLEEDVADAMQLLDDLEKSGISLRQVTDDLLTDGVSKFVEPFTKLLGAVERRSRDANKARINTQKYSLPPTLQAKVSERLKAWDTDGGTRRLFAGDASLWTGSDEANWIGWLGIVDQQIENEQRLLDLQQEVRKEGLTHAVLLGMGGSSLCPEVWKETFGRIGGSPELFVLDSTDPAQIRTLEAKLDLARTLFIVSSKSGSTLEPNIFKAYFFDRVKRALGSDQAGSRFIAVTDPGSNLEKEARADGFRHIFAGVKSIGGRYSALSNFGMVPAAVMGLDVAKLLDEAERMLHACAPGVPADENPGLVLGTILGIAANQGADKLTLIASPGIYDLGAWLEQLIAESTGKQGKGIIPVDREAVGAPPVYGDDRVFAYLRLEDAPDAAQDAAVAALEKAGKPVVTIRVATKYDLSEEFVRWEIATAIAGAVIGINPFNQPDVEASKIATKSLTSEYEKTGKLPSEAPFFESDGVKLFADAKNADALKSAAGASPSLTSYLRAHLARLGQGDYFALLGYVEMNAAHEAALQRTRHQVRDRKRVATCLGFGPRFLHSTGQGYKGGPNSGVFLQITCDDAQDLPVPGQKYTFGLVKAAQARGDFQVLAERNRRALRIHLGSDVAAGLRTLDAAIDKALA
ncbi:MAG TPA: bifunctional transaldolase/phosoglucose isomerase [Vicinamibacterales bacterium]|nr:bifunctional transaldolase/phosoglucose isomerase [Vicinamibacterales bacterium]